MSGYYYAKIFEKPPISINSSTKWFELRTATDGNEAKYPNYRLCASTNRN